MKQLLKAITLFPVTVGLLVLGGTGCGGGKDLKAAQSEAASFSNKLTQAEGRLSECERTAQTALTNLGLAAADFASLSNRFVKLRTQLSETEGRGSRAAAQASERAARIAELEAQQAETVNLINQLREENARATAKAVEAKIQIADANGRAQSAINEREVIKARITEMELRLWNPEWLRAQLKRVRNFGAANSSFQAAPAAETPLPPAAPPMAANAFEPDYPAMRVPPKAPLMLLPDGRVRTVEVAPPTASK